jgi:hypothetical protein
MQNITRQLRKQVAGVATAAAAAARRPASTLARTAAVAQATPAAAAAQPAASAAAVRSASSVRSFSSSLRPASAAGVGAGSLLRPSSARLSPLQPAVALSEGLADVPVGSELPVKKMNLFTALNDAMSVALMTDPKVRVCNDAGRNWGFCTSARHATVSPGMRPPRCS